MKLIGDKLSSVRGGRTLFAELSFAVAAGEALLVMGPNGAGKTTLSAHDCRSAAARRRARSPGGRRA